MKNKAAQSLGRKGGKARLKTMTAEQRKEAARKAITARWGKKSQNTFPDNQYKELTKAIIEANSGDGFTLNDWAIDISNVLIAIQKQDLAGVYAVSEVGKIFRFMGRSINPIDIFADWNLSKSHLDQQSKECLKALHEIICGNNKPSNESV